MDSQIVHQQSVLDIIANAANDSSVDPNKMTALLDMQIRILEVEREKSFNLALAQLQAEMPTVTKHGKVDFTTTKGRTNYAFERYEDIDAAARPLMSKYGFSFVVIETEIPARYKGTLLHKDGHSMSGYFEAPPDTTGNKNSIQSINSTRTYVRRALLKGLLNIVTIGEDDDAQSFSYINAVQVAQLKERIASDGIDMQKFLKQMGVDSVEHLPSKMFETVIRAINERSAKRALAQKEVSI